MKADGTVACWGSNLDILDNLVGQATPPDGTFVSVSAGTYHTCGVKTDGIVVCWGSDDEGQATPPGGTFVSVSSGSSHSCGVKTDGTVVCWGSNKYGQSTGAVDPPVSPGSTEAFILVSAGLGHSCGVRTEGTVACWGDDSLGQSTSPGGNFISVSAGALHSCGLKIDGTVACWGSNEDGNGNHIGQSTTPGGTFISVSAGWVHSCGVKTDGTVACWGDDSHGQSTTPNGKFTSVSSGILHSCGMKQSGTVACWGADIVRLFTPDVSSFVAVDSGGLHTCGVKTDGLVHCWGSDDDSSDIHRGQSTPPTGDGKFLSVSAGAFHSCGVKEDSTVVCWGSDEDDDGNFEGQSVPPSDDTFVSVSSGAFHTCGLKEDGTAVCWGDDDFGQSTIPKRLVIHVQDRAVLVALYNSTDGTNWFPNDNWLSEAPLAEWYGVATDQNGRVTIIALSFNKLRGTIPSELSNLASLARLGLAVNQLTGSIPPELGSLTNLETLNLSSNRLSGAIPPELGSLTNLRDLYLFRNQLSGSIPPELGNLTNLEILNLSSNQLRGSMPVELGRLTALRTLDIEDNNLTGAIPPELGGLPNLQRLLLGGSNRWSGCIPEGLRDVEDNDLDPRSACPSVEPSLHASAPKGWVVLLLSPGRSPVGTLVSRLRPRVLRPLRQGVEDAQGLEEPHDGELDDILDGLGLQVEGGRHGQDSDTQPGQGRHVLQLDRVEGRLPRHDGQGAPLLQAYVGGPADQVVRQPVGDGGNGGHAARHDGHAACRKGAAGYGRPEVSGRMVDEVAGVGPTLQRGAEGLLHLFLPHHPGCGGRRGDDGHAHLQEPVDGRGGDDRPAGPRHAYDQGLLLRILHLLSHGRSPLSRLISCHSESSEESKGPGPQTTILDSSTPLRCVSE